jgi:hypothetical protein
MATQTEKSRIMILVDLFSSPKKTILNGGHYSVVFGYIVSDTAEVICDTIVEKKLNLSIRYNEQYKK